MCKIERRGPLMPLAPHAMLAHQWRKLVPILVQTFETYLKLLQLEGETCPWSANCDTNCPSFELWLLLYPHEKKNRLHQINSSEVDTSLMWYYYLSRMDRHSTKQNLHSKSVESTFHLVIIRNKEHYLWRLSGRFLEFIPMVLKNQWPSFGI